MEWAAVETERQLRNGFSQHNSHSWINTNYTKSLFISTTFLLKVQRILNVIRFWMSLNFRGKHINQKWAGKKESARQRGKIKRSNFAQINQLLLLPIRNRNRFVRALSFWRQCLNGHTVLHFAFKSFLPTVECVYEKFREPFSNGLKFKMQPKETKSDRFFGVQMTASMPEDWRFKQSEISPIYYRISNFYQFYHIIDGCFHASVQDDSSNVKQWWQKRHTHQTLTSHFNVKSMPILIRRQPKIKLQAFNVLVGSLTLRRWIVDIDVVGAHFTAFVCDSIADFGDNKQPTAF